jgi:hypothetical protein
MQSPFSFTVNEIHVYLRKQIMPRRRVRGGRAAYPVRWLYVGMADYAQHAVDNGEVLAPAETGWGRVRWG